MATETPFFKGRIPAHVPGQIRKLKRTEQKYPHSRTPLHVVPMAWAVSIAVLLIGQSATVSGEILQRQILEVSLRPSTVDAKAEELRERLKLGAGLSTAFEPRRAMKKTGAHL